MEGCPLNPSQVGEEHRKGKRPTLMQNHFLQAQILHLPGLAMGF